MKTGTLISYGVVKIWWKENIPDGLLSMHCFGKTAKFNFVALSFFN